MQNNRPSGQTFDWPRIRGIIFGFRRELVVANIVALLATLASVPTPLLLPLMVDEVLLQQPGAITGFLSSVLPAFWQRPWVYIGLVLLATVVLRVLALIFNVWQSRKFTIISKDVVFRIRQSLLQKLGRVSLAEYETLGSGSVSSRFVTDLNTLDQFIGSTVSRLIVALLTMVGIAGVLLWLHWQLALVILCLNPVVIYITASMGKRIKSLKTRENKAFDRFQQALTETLEGIQQIRAANREQHYLLRLLERARGVRDASTEFSWRNDAAGRLSFVVFVAGVDMFRAAAMVAVLLSGLSIGEMFAVFGYLWFMLTPVNELLAIQYGLYAANAALKRINTLLELEQEAHYPQLENPFAGQQTVGLELRDVHFRYGDIEVLKGVNLKVQPGEKVALVGASGGGKSTLVKVVLGLYHQHQGQVLYNGVPLERSGLECVREHVAIVLQHPALFDTSVRENLTLGRECDDNQLWQALKIAQLDGFVEQLKDGLATRVGNQGVRLSGGQRQRLAIARMIISKPRLVILDEATSALDAETEYRLHQALEQFLTGTTTLIIAHRLSAVRQADRACVFDHGRIVEQGSHQQLLALNGRYARLYGDLQGETYNPELVSGVHK